MSTLRQRVSSKDDHEGAPKESFVEPPVKECKFAKAVVIRNGTFWLTRIVILRYIAFVYFVAFLVAYDQNEALIGKNGLLPGHLYFNLIKNKTSNNLLTRLKYAPSVIWLFDYEKHLDTILNALALIGLIITALVIVSGRANICIMLLLWVLYHSIVSIGQRWYSFGWESQLLETGFLAAFLCPLFTWKQFPRETPPPKLIIFCFRWLIFRIMLGAGLIKIRGDKCWLDLTCMHYHYETQPVPNPLSYFMHQEPGMFHKFETMVNHFIELFVPFMLLLPRSFCMVGGLLQIMFQVILILSGNLSFLNWLTIAPSLACFDDASLSWMFSIPKKKVVVVLEKNPISSSRGPKLGYNIRRAFNMCFFATICYLSLPIIANLFSQSQIMNTSFDPLKIVNTYGAFGSITKERNEVILEGTHSDNPDNPNTKWLEYEFKCKPGRTSRRPCIISPYHYRLDWLMWFAAFQDYTYNEWLIHLGIKFLMNDNMTMTLIAHNPFHCMAPPKWIRAVLYRYKFTSIWNDSNGHWWKRKNIRVYLLPISLDTIKGYANMKQWTIVNNQSPSQTC